MMSENTKISVVLVCTVWYTAVCSSAVFVLFRMNSGPCP